MEPDATTRFPTATRSRCSTPGSPRRGRASRTIPTRWRSPPPTPTGGRRCGWCCSRATGPTASCSTPTPKAARAARSRANPRAALLFHWKSLRRQVRIEGPVEPVERRRGRRLFRLALRDSQLGAGLGPVAPARSRATYLDRVDAAARSAIEGGDGAAPAALDRLPRSSPSGSNSGSTAPHRLHERRLFTRAGDGWSEGLLYP